MPRPSRREEILEAATLSVAEHGYDGTRTRLIAEKAGLSEAAIYRHFGSVDELTQEVYRVNFARYAALVEEAVAAGDEPAQKIANVVRATLKRYREDRPAFITTLIRIPNFLPSLPAGTTLPIDLLAAVIRDAQAHGQMRSGEPHLLAAMFFGAVLRPMLFAELTDRAVFEMFENTGFDQTIEEVAMAALFISQGPVPS